MIMKIKNHLYFAITLLFSLNQTVAFAYETLGDDIETPDTLLQTAYPDAQKTSSGDGNIVISSGGAKNNEINTPDPILSTVKVKESSVSRDFKVKSRIVTEDDKALESIDPLLKTTKTSSTRKTGSAKPGYLDKKSKDQDSLEMPDPLMDSMN